MVEPSRQRLKVDLIELANDIERIGFMLENPPPEFAAESFFVVLAYTICISLRAYER
jgi:hypothetical protein